MAYEQKDGDFSLFRNSKKEEGSNQPDMTGSAMIDGVKYKVSAWTKEKGDNKFLTGKIQVDTYRKQEEPKEQPQRSGGTTSTPPPIDDLPF